MKTDWHNIAISSSTPVDASYKNTQNVRRFMIAECGKDFKFDRDFMAWISNGESKTMGDVVNEWLRRQSGKAK